MELKPGYKQTEVGVIPEEWDQTEIGNRTVKVGSGITPTGGARVYRQSGRPFVRSQNVGRGSLLLDDIAFIDDQIHESFSATEIEVGDVFLNITGASIGRSAVADARVRGGNVNQHVCIIRPKAGELDSRFLNHFLISTSGQRQIDSFQAGGNRQGLNFGQIRSFRLPLPPLLEQRTIAAALGDVDALLGALTGLIAKKRDLKQAAMQQLLTGKKRLPGFSGECKVKRLGEVVDVDPENLASNTPPNYAFNYISLEDVDLGTLRNYSEQVFSTAPSRARRKLRNGDILVSTVRPNLKSHLLFNIAAPHWVCSTGFSVLRCREGATHPGYVFFHLFGHSISRQIEMLLTGSNYPAINSGDVRALQIPLPGFAEQTAIATVLSDMDAEIAALEARLAKTRALKQGMMQELLTGKTRLV